MPKVYYLILNLALTFSAILNNGNRQSVLSNVIMKDIPLSLSLSLSFSLSLSLCKFGVTLFGMTIVFEREREKEKERPSCE